MGVFMKKLLLVSMVAVGFAQQVNAEALSSKLEPYLFRYPTSYMCKAMYDLCVMHETVEQMRKEAQQQEEAQEQQRIKKIRFISNFFSKARSRDERIIFIEKKEGMLARTFNVHDKNRE